MGARTCNGGGIVVAGDQVIALLAERQKLQCALHITHRLSTIIWIASVAGKHSIIESYS